MNYSTEQITEILHVHLQPDNDVTITEVATDSRKIFFPASTLFFALPGTYKSGELFIEDLIAKGVRSFVVNENYASAHEKNIIFFRVADVLIALQNFASWHRNQFQLPVIGITGSNGKTIVKELLFQMLYKDEVIVRSPKSYNSQLGVALSVCEINKHHTLAIFEAGISRIGEMDLLQKMIQPQIGIFTFAGAAHAEGFKSFNEKIKEKLKLFVSSKILFYCADEKILDEEIQQFKKNTNPSLVLFTWGKQTNADLKVTDIACVNGTTNINCEYKGDEFYITIPFTDEASLHNCLTALCVLLYLNYPVSNVQKKMLELRPVQMRLELKKAINNCSIINDSYNSDINSINIALHFLMQQQQHVKRTVILSDVFESGDASAAFYEKIAAMIAQLNLHYFIGVGCHLKKYANLFRGKNQVHFYENTAELIAALPQLNFHNETILLKGARVFQFEKISEALELQTHQTVLEINLDAMRHNLNLYRAQLNKDVKLMVMVKAFSYGTGSFEVANLLQHAGIDYLAVAYTDEGIALRENGITLPIMVLNSDESAFNNLVEFNLEPEIFSLSLFKKFSNYLQEQNITKYKIHLKLDTGMHRLGFVEEDLPALCGLLESNKICIVASVFSHLAASDDKNEDAFTEKQRYLFLQMSEKIESVLGYRFIKHLSNTAGISRLPSLQMDMVRLGIGLYGVDANAEMQQKLQVVNTLRSTIAQIKTVAEGESVGYGRKAFLNAEKRIAVVRIGYADGYRRMFGNGAGQIWVNGKLAPIVGNVCMDMTMIDVTGINANEEDEVIIFGNELPVQQLATWGSTIAYEIFTDVSQRVQRIYYQE